MKTAEETLREIGNGTISKSVAIKAMERYSEERLKEWKEKFKAKVKERIDDHFSIGAMDVLHEEEIKTIIDSL